jgi:hypothetical protein
LVVDAERLALEVRRRRGGRCPEREQTCYRNRQDYETPHIPSLEIKSFQMHRLRRPCRRRIHPLWENFVDSNRFSAKGAD